MDGSGSLRIILLEGLGELDRAAWDACANPAPDPVGGAPYDPFLSWDFLQALEEAGCVGGRTGWRPMHLLAREASGAVVGVAPLYLKDHSYGEYVFDHGWADAFMRAGGAYYPKLLSAVPFTPVPGRRLLARDAGVVHALGEAMVRIARENGLSSVHVNFAEAEQVEALKHSGFLLRAGLQYHWFNRGYDSFADFLGRLSSNKRKNLRKERVRAAEGLHINRLQGDDIKASDWDFFFRCYMDTGARKWGSPYLNRDFFALLGERMGERIVLFIAEDDGTPIASALNFVGGEALYGRYWGAVAHRPFLHFELCYYQAIDLAIELKLPRVEAGAQGEHKLARGYEPVPTLSAHWIAHPGLRQAVMSFLAAEAPAVMEESEMLSEHTPFKKGE